jgi:hypothetical protein
MGEPWEPRLGVPRVGRVRRLPRDALEVETSIAEGEPALQALLMWARETAGTLEAHAAEKGICNRRPPFGLAAMPRDFAPRGTGDVGPAVTRADGVLLPREQKLRGRDDGSRVGKFAVPRTCYRTARAPGLFPLDAQVNRPARCDAYFLQAWRTVFEGEHPGQERAGVCAQLFQREVAESVVREVAQQPPPDDEAF